MAENSSNKNDRIKGNLKKAITVSLVIMVGMTSCLGLMGCDKIKETSSKNGVMVSEVFDQKDKKADNKSKNEKKEDEKKVENNISQEKSPSPQITGTSTEPSKNTSIPASVKPEDKDHYFQDALFIGDSRMQGFMLYSGVVATGYTEPGLDVNTVLTKPMIKNNGNRLTIPQALELSQFGKIYIKLGMNELGWVYTDKFIVQYAAVIDKVKELQPNAKIYVEAILPVTASKDSKGTYINNKRIAEYNGLISQMATEKGVNFIDASSAVADENGFLYEEATTDGVHLNKKYCQLWYQYLLEHK